jgi:predicted aspartyl protease
MLVVLLTLRVVAVGSGGDQNDLLGSVLIRDGFRRAPLIMADRDLALSVKINGVAAALALSTATTSTVLDANALAKFGLTGRSTMLPLYTGVGKAHERMGLTRVKSLEFNDIVLADFEAATFDGSALGRTHSRELDGIFGFAQLKNLGAFVDCAHKVLYVNPSGRHRETSRRLTVSMPLAGFVCIPMHVNDVGQYQVDCRVNEHHIPFVVEVGEFVTIVRSEEARKVALTIGKPFVRAESAGHLQTVLSHATAKTFSVGSLDSGVNTVAVGDTVHNLLGLDFLSSHAAVIDCGGKNLYLRP